MLLWYVLVYWLLLQIAHASPMQAAKEARDKDLAARESSETSKGSTLGRARYRSSRAVSATSSSSHETTEQAMTCKPGKEDSEGDPQPDSEVDFNITVVPFDAWVDSNGLTDLRAPAYRNMLTRRLRQAVMKYIEVPEWVPSLIEDYNSKLTTAQVSPNFLVQDLFDNLSLTDKRKLRYTVEDHFDFSKGINDATCKKAAESGKSLSY